MLLMYIDFGSVRSLIRFAFSCCYLVWKKKHVHRFDIMIRRLRFKYIKILPHSIWIFIWFRNDATSVNTKYHKQWFYIFWYFILILNSQYIFYKPMRYTYTFIYCVGFRINFGFAYFIKIFRHWQIPCKFGILKNIYSTLHWIRR